MLGMEKVNEWTVEAGCKVDAMISTSRVKESYGGEEEASSRVPSKERDWDIP